MSNYSLFSKRVTAIYAERALSPGMQECIEIGERLLNYRPENDMAAFMRNHKPKRKNKKRR